MIILEGSQGSFKNRVDMVRGTTFLIRVSLPAYRIPGDIKPLYKWSLDQRNSPNSSTRTELKQALSQVNVYTMQHHTRYSFTLTDCEFVAVRRLHLQNVK